MNLIVLIIATLFMDEDQVEKCRAAVHGDLTSATSACPDPEPRVDLTKPAGLDDICLAALTAGRQAARFGPGLPREMRDGLIRDFDKKEAACRAPRDPATPERKIIQLWD